ncbi:hypothetical protein PIB30_034812 [Stylosanthes scabra]|uniref:Uncharacterized protein n=1 Tax=Stylosanthes scabra TaxID=79078 RepID=A0ABU6UEX5_9FABA|nr:hypothetical protein [Stylosanthes scabra]
MNQGVEYGVRLLRVAYRVCEESKQNPNFSGTGSRLKGWRSALSDSTRSSFSEDRLFHCVVRRTRDIALECNIGLVFSVEHKLRRFCCV